MACETEGQHLCLWAIKAGGTNSIQNKRVNELDLLGSWILLSEYAKGPVGFESSHPDICHTASRSPGLGFSESHLFPFPKPAQCLQLTLSMHCLARIKGTTTSMAHGRCAVFYLISLACLEPVPTFKRSSHCSKTGGKDFAKR